MIENWKTEKLGNTSAENGIPKVEVHETHFLRSLLDAVWLLSMNDRESKCTRLFVVGK